MPVFLSHSGSGTDAAKALKERIMAAPSARDAGLEVWPDIDEMRPAANGSRPAHAAIGYAP